MTEKKKYTAHNVLSGLHRRGDRKDGELIRDLDGMHYITPLIYPNRCDNEAYIAETVELSPIQAYVEKKNAALLQEAEKTGEQPFLYTPFHVITAALLKTIELRPKMNRFIANKTMYQRKYLSASFVVKKEFSDEGGEALAILYAEPDDTLTSLHKKLEKQIRSCRSEEKDPSSDSMDMFLKMPRKLSRFLVWIITRLDIKGLVPESLIASDPYYSTVLLSNVGSIKLKCGYHHLTNWGTNSIFCMIGAVRPHLVLEESKKSEPREMLELGLTIDERLADGYYYSKTIALMKTLLLHPELLEKPLDEEVEYQSC